MEKSAFSAGGLCLGPHLPSPGTHWMCSLPPPLSNFMGSSEPGLVLLLIHVFLPFVMYGEKGRMNGQTLIGGADDARPGPLWTDPFGNKAGEAAHRGVPPLTLALAGGPPEQVCLPRAASVSGNLSACAPSSAVSFLQSLGSRVLTLCRAVRLRLSWMPGSGSRKSHGTHLGLDTSH